MARTTPFFRHNAHATGLMAPEPERYPYHDDDACPVGQAVKASGEWQYYAPQRIEETRIRCLLCAGLGLAGH